MYDGNTTWRRQLSLNLAFTVQSFLSLEHSVQPQQKRQGQRKNQNNIPNKYENHVQVQNQLITQRRLDACHVK